MKLLFVCSGNAHRSPLAEALLKKMRPDLEADSAGTNVAIPIAEKVREYLEKQNAQQYLKKTPESLYSKIILVDFVHILICTSNLNLFFSSFCPLQ